MNELLTGRTNGLSLPHLDVSDAVVLDERVGTLAHRDLALIPSNDDDGITINRTKTGISPFVPIVKTPTYSANSGTLSGYSIEIEDPDEDTGFRCVGNVSPGYLLMTNQQVRDLAWDIAEQSGMPFRETRIYWDGTRFMHAIDFTNHRADLGDGDEVGLSLVTRSSYDKSWRFETALMGKRFACDNRVLSGEFFVRVGFKHLHQGSEETTWQEVVQQGMAVITQAPQSLGRFADALRAMRRVPMTDARLRSVWNLNRGIGDGVKGQSMTRYCLKYPVA